MADREFDLVVRGGILVTSDQTRETDLAIQGEKIAAVGQGLKGRRFIDAHGLLVLPGAIDPHVHLEMPVGKTCSSDDWLTGTRAAAFGGTTTVIDFVEPQPGESLTNAFAARRDLAASKAVVDFSLHMTISSDEPPTIQEIPAISGEGIKSFKTYLTYEGFHLSDSAMLNVLTAVRETGGIVLVHAENDAIIAYLKRRLRSENRISPRNHALSRPAISEGEAVQRSLALAEVAGVRLYVVHVSTALGVEALRSACQRGVHAFGETCPQYLLLSEQELYRPDFEGAKFVCTPPLRSDSDRSHLWKGLADDVLQTVGTDHCPFLFHGQKDLGLSTYEEIPSGLPGIEARLALLYTFGVRSRRISLNRWVQICCTNPAQIFGLYPRKGNLASGADADVVLFDPQKSVVLTKSALHEQVDYTPYEGFVLQGYPVTTILRGRIIVENGNFTASPGSGRFLVQEPGIFPEK